MVTSRNAVAFVNIHPQKSKWVTAKIILVSPASILVGEWLQRQRHIGAWPLYILFKCDVRHPLHCFVCTDTHLFNFTKGKTDLVNQRWRRTTCLQHQCYDVGCYPWINKAGHLGIRFIYHTFADICTPTSLMRRSACAHRTVLSTPLFLEQNIKHFVGPDLGPNCLLKIGLSQPLWGGGGGGEGGGVRHC